MDKVIKLASDVYELVRIPLIEEEEEHLLVVVLNGGNCVKSIHWMCSGTDDQVPISTKMIARVAVVENAVGVILVHNHPSGNPKPSRTDVVQTDAVRKALSLFNISLVDHVIVAKNKFYSFTDDEEWSYKKK